MSIDFSLSLRVIIKTRALKELPLIIRNIGADEVVLFTDKVVLNIIGKEVVQILEDSNMTVHLHLVGPSNKEEFERGRKFLEDLNLNVVIGLGGGRVIDAAKYAAYYEGAIFISAPTVISHDGIASPTVSFKGDKGEPISMFTKPPAFVVADISVISKAPRRLLASGFADILGKITSIRDALLAYKLRGDNISLYALELASMALKMVVKNVEKIARMDPHGIEVLTLAAITSGIAAIVDGSTRPISGSEHMFSHALDIIYPEKKSLHGEQVGVGTIMMSYLHGLNWRKIRSLLLKVGAPVDATSLKIPPDIIVDALTIAHKVRKRFTILGSQGLSREAAKRLAEETLVI